MLKPHRNRTCKRGDMTAPWSDFLSIFFICFGSTILRLKSNRERSSCFGEKIQGGFLVLETFRPPTYSNPISGYCRFGAKIQTCDFWNFLNWNWLIRPRRSRIWHWFYAEMIGPIDIWNYRFLRSAIFDHSKSFGILGGFRRLISQSKAHIEAMPEHY